MTDWLRRYRDGDHLRVWTEIRDAPERDHEAARAVAYEMMGRLRESLGVVCEELERVGYWFASASPCRPPAAADLAAMDSLEREIGPIPLALRAFYEVVGSVDLRCDEDVLADVNQLLDGMFEGSDEEIQEALAALDDDDDPEDAAVIWLGMYDPLRVAPFEEGLGRDDYIYPPELLRARRALSLANDPDSYWGSSAAILLPDTSPDPRLIGETRSFVDYLRTAMSNGGFVGGPFGGDTRAPFSPVVAAIRARILPF